MEVETKNLPGGRIRRFAIPFWVAGFFLGYSFSFGSRGSILKEVNVLQKYIYQIINQLTFVKKFLMAVKRYNRIKVVLAEQGRTNLWLADKLDMSPNTVSKWCTNTIQPTIETLYKIAHALDVEARDLLVTWKD